MQRAPIPVREKLPAKVAPYHGTPFGFHSALHFSLFPLSHFQTTQRTSARCQSSAKNSTYHCRESLARSV